MRQRGSAGAADVNAVDRYGRTELMKAARYGELKRAEEQLKLGADVSICDTDTAGYNALHEAARHGDAAITELLLAHGADANAPTAGGSTEKGGVTALILAAQEEKGLPVAELLLWALRLDMPGDEKLEIPKALLARGAKIGIVGDGGVTPFMIAAARENFTPETLQWLLDHGADPKGADKNGNSALYYAARSENAAARLLWLISLGLYDVNERDKDGASISALALGRAADPKLLAALLDAGADPKAASKDGYGLMHIAARKLCDAAKDQERTKEGADRAWNDALACFRLLCDKGVPLNERYGKNGETPLLVASGWGAPLKVVRTLVEAGADPKIAAADGKTALSLAESWSVPGVPEYLKSKM